MEILTKADLELFRIRMIADIKKRWRLLLTIAKMTFYRSEVKLFES